MLTKSASLCVLGTPSKTKNDTSAKLDLTLACLTQLDKDTPFLVLPAGMFFHDKTLAPLLLEERLDALNALEWSKTLAKNCGNTAIIAGVDIDSEDEATGQYSITIDKSGVRAVSRKIFPTKGEVATGAFIQAPDFNDVSRFINAGQSNAIMHTCYDIFGSVDILSGKSSPNRLSHVPSPSVKNTNKKKCYEAYADILRPWASDTAHPFVSVNIHHFAKPGRDIFYQRHGIASASAAFNGALVIGAAHFEETLPNVASQSTLAAYGVPYSHLSAHFHRQAHSLEALDFKEIRTAQHSGVLRCFAI